MTVFVGILGVIVGAMLQVARDQWQQRREQKAKLRTAVRLVTSELYVAKAIVAPISETGSWGPEQDVLPTTNLAEQAGVLAAGLSTHDWKLFEGALLGIQHINRIRARLEQSGGTFTEYELKRAAAIHDHVVLTIDAFERALGEAPAIAAASRPATADRLGEVQ
ncbi:MULTISPECIES: hypothetical protein [Mycobacterium]|uniref:hypothetical protein n=1 Tax=Mycobacterium TaxID=1763 RepID=UPI0010579488|nr:MULTISPECIES: hypothetical protein [Mycobacterium]MDM4138783.1 hypothetical protein [Mycobacterium sp. FLAC0960]